MGLVILYITYPLSHPRVRSVREMAWGGRDGKDGMHRNLPRYPRQRFVPSSSHFVDHTAFVTAAVYVAPVTSEDMFHNQNSLPLSHCTIVHTV